jgi:hypothetical protein
MIGRIAVFTILLISVIVSATVGGVIVYYGAGSHFVTTVTQTDTVTSYNTIVQVVTATPANDAPSMVTIDGTILSELNYPIAIDFCKFLSEPLSDNASVLAQLNGAYCGAYSASVTNQTTENFGQNISYYEGEYSVNLPNNATYLLQVRLLESQSGPKFEEQAGWLPLNYTSSSRISDYGINCYQTNVNGDSTFQCSSGFG